MGNLMTPDETPYRSEPGHGTIFNWLKNPQIWTFVFYLGGAEFLWDGGLPVIKSLKNVATVSNYATRNQT